MLMIPGNAWIKDAFVKLFQRNLILKKESLRANKELLEQLFKEAEDGGMQSCILNLKVGKYMLWDFNQGLVPWYEGVYSDGAS